MPFPGCCRRRSSAWLPLPLLALLPGCATYTLLVRFGSAGGQRLLALRPDRLWLSSACDDVSGSLRHSSLWHLEPAPDLPVADGMSTIACHLVRTDSLFRVHARPSPGLSVRLLLTPLTVLCDCTVLLPFNVLAGVAHDVEEQAEETRKGRRR